jgi:hypothetical protein
MKAAGKMNAIQFLSFLTNTLDYNFLIEYTVNFQNKHLTGMAGLARDKTVSLENRHCQPTRHNQHGHEEK